MADVKFSNVQDLGRLIIALLGSLFVFVLFILVLGWLKAPTEDVQLQQLHEVECSFAGTSDSPETWRICHLPHNWDVQNPDYGGDAWYRFTLARQTSTPESPALWLAASMNARVTVNGIDVGGADRMNEPVSRHWNEYLLFSIPKSILNRESNRVMIQVRGYANASSGLSKLFVGPISLLKEKQQVLLFRSHMLTYGSFVVTMLIGLLAGVAAIAGKNRTAAYFSLGCLIGTLYILDTIVVNIPFSRDAWERGVNLSIVWSTVFFMFFVSRVLGYKHRWITYGLLAYGFIGSLLLLLVSETMLLPVAAMWEGILLSMLVVTDLICFWRWLTGGGRISLMVSLALFAVNVSFYFDWVPWAFGLGVEPPYTFYLGPAGFVTIMAALLVTRLIFAYQHELGTAMQLTKKVEVQGEALEREHEAMLKLSEEKAVRNERDRIVRELHDGVGGLLANAMSQEKVPPQIRDQLRMALNELRMVMGGLDESADISALLGALRSVLQVEADAHGINLGWLIEEVPTAVPDNAASGMQLVRIVQEAVHNAMRHAGANKIEVFVDQQCCTISDNGKGFDSDVVALGRGLKNMEWRASKLHANFGIASDDSGTCIRICWQ